MEYQASLVVAVAFSRVSVKVQNGNFLELNIIKWINEVKSTGSTDSDSPTRTKASSGPSLYQQVREVTFAVLI